MTIVSVYIYIHSIYTYKHNTYSSTSDKSIVSFYIILYLSNMLVHVNIYIEYTVHNNHIFLKMDI